MPLLSGALRQTVKNLKLKPVNRFLRKQSASGGIDINAELPLSAYQTKKSDGRGTPLLAIAIIGKNTAVCRQLLLAGADVDQSSGIQPNKRSLAVSCIILASVYKTDLDGLFSCARVLKLAVQTFDSKVENKDEQFKNLIENAITTDASFVAEFLRFPHEAGGSISKCIDAMRLAVKEVVVSGLSVGDLKQTMDLAVACDAKTFVRQYLVQGFPVGDEQLNHFKETFAPGIVVFLKILMPANFITKARQLACKYLVTPDKSNERSSIRKQLKGNLRQALSVNRQFVFDYLAAHCGKASLQAQTGEDTQDYSFLLTMILDCVELVGREHLNALQHAHLPLLNAYPKGEADQCVAGQALFTSREELDIFIQLSGLDGRGTKPIACDSQSARKAGHWQEQTQAENSRAASSMSPSPDTVIPRTGLTS